MGGYYNGQAVGVPYLNGAKHNMIRVRNCFFPPFYTINDYWTRWEGEPNNSVSLLMLKWDTAEIYNWHYECARDGWEPRSLTYRFADELHDGRTIVPIENYVHNPAPIESGEQFTKESDAIQLEYSSGSIVVTNTDSGREGWAMTEVTLSPGDYELRVNVVSVNDTYGAPQGPIISVAAGETTLNTAPYAGNNLIHRCPFTLSRRRRVQLRLHANVIPSMPVAATSFNHIMCMSTEAWAELDALGLTWVDDATVSDPIY